jgi:F0F1-type ATP synthase epsilon subunit
MKLSIYSIKEVLFQGTASLLSCKTEMGEITILDKHEPLISVLTEGVIRVVNSEKKEQFFPVKSGFLEVKPDDEVRCIIEQ